MTDRSARVARALNGSGRKADSPVDIPALGWRLVLRRALKRSFDQNIALVAAGTAFYGFIAIVPLLIVATIVYSWFGDPGGLARDAYLLTLVLPKEAVEHITAQLERVIRASAGTRGLGFAVSVAIAAFGARNAASAIITALNIAYDEEEKRPLEKTVLVALGIALSGLALAFASLVVLGMLGALRRYFPDSPGPSLMGFQIAAYALVIGVASAAATFLYRYAPCRRKARWRWITPGSTIAAIGWVLIASTFGPYVANSDDFATRYGPASAAIVVLVGLYLSALAFLFGAEVNAELERQTACDTSEDAAASS